MSKIGKKTRKPGDSDESIGSCKSDGSGSSSAGSGRRLRPLQPKPESSTEGVKKKGEYYCYYYPKRMKMMRQQQNPLGSLAFPMYMGTTPPLLPSTPDLSYYHGNCSTSAIADLAKVFQPAAIEEEVIAANESQPEFHVDDNFAYPSVICPDQLPSPTAEYHFHLQPKRVPDKVPCPDCNMMMFPRSLRNHARRCAKVPVDEETVFRCAVCGKGFDSITKLRIHVTKAHPDASL